jgi:hypothetical protein
MKDEEEKGTESTRLTHKIPNTPGPVMRAKIRIASPIEPPRVHHSVDSLNAHAELVKFFDSFYY